MPRIRPDARARTQLEGKLLDKRLHFPKGSASAGWQGTVGNAVPLGGLEAGFRDRAVRARKPSPEVRRPNGKRPDGKETPHSCYGGLKGVAKSVQ